MKRVTAVIQAVATSLVIVAAVGSFGGCSLERGTEGEQAVVSPSGGCPAWGFLLVASQFPEEEGFDVRWDGQFFSSPGDSVLEVCLKKGFTFQVGVEGNTLFLATDEEGNPVPLAFVPPLGEDVRGPTAWSGGGGTVIVTVP